MLSSYQKIVEEALETDIPPYLQVPCSVEFPDKSYDLPRELIELECKFAQKCVDVMNISLLQALADYTEFLFLVRIPKDGYKSSKAWKTFKKRFWNPDSPADSILEFIKTRQDEKKVIRNNAFGVMGFDLLPDERVLQWHTIPVPVAADEASHFKIDNLVERILEMRATVEYIKNNFGDKVDKVMSYSWLFNIEAAQRILPGEFYRSPVEVDRGFTGLARWGQFLDKTFKVKRELVEDFASTIDRARSWNGLLDAFPLKVLQCECDIDVFYKYYRV